MVALPYAASQIPPTKGTGVAWSCEPDKFLNVGHPSTQDANLWEELDVVGQVCLRNLLIADLLVLESSMRFLLARHRQALGSTIPIA